MIRTVDFRYVVVRNGADYKYLNPLSAPIIRCDDSADIKTSFSGTFLADSEVNWLSDEIRIELIIDGTKYPLGIYLPATVSYIKDATTESVNIEAYDRCWKLRDNHTSGYLYYASGTNYLTPVENLLAAAGISLVSVIPTAATFSEGREDWEIGTSYLEIINQLLSEINYNPLWFDFNGMAIIEPASVPTAANIEHVFDNSNVESLIIPNIQRVNDIYSAPNVFICICSNADKAAGMSATSVNSNPQSPLSTVARGRSISKVIHVDNIADQTELQAYADRLRNESMITGETIEIETALLPGFGVSDVSAIHYDDLFAVCIERSWEMNLSVGGRMRHTLEKVVVNLA